MTGRPRLAVGLTVAFSVPYYVLGRFALMPVRRLPLTFVDRAIPFSPGWIWAYVSLYVLIPAIALLSRTRDELRRYAAGFLLLSGLGFLCFLLFPVAGPRPPAAELPAWGLFRLVLLWDTPLNSMPSLHAGLAAYSVLAGRRILAGAPARLRWGVVVASSAWAALVLYATLATKQHYALDLPPGVLLAILADRAAWSGRKVS